MASFDLGVDASPLDFRLLRTSVVTLFWRPALLVEVTNWLRLHGYTVADLDASNWVSDSDLHRDIAAALITSS